MNQAGGRTSSVQQICDDLVAEHRALDELVAVADLSTPTPAPGWSVGDQISHLWFFDQRAVLALTDPATFARDAAELLTALAGDVSARGLRPRTPSPDRSLALAGPGFARASIRRSRSAGRSARAS